MAFFKKVGDFFTKDIPRVVTSDIPRALGLDKPNITDPEFYVHQLEGERARNKQLKVQVPIHRTKYYTARAAFDLALANYKHMTEDFTSKLGRDVPEKKFSEVEDTSWDDTSDDNFADKSGRALRGLGGFVSLGLSDALFAKGDGEKELAHLRKQNAQLTALYKKFDAETHKLNKKCKALSAAVTALTAELAAQGFKGPDAIYDAQLAKGVDKAAEQIASDMLADGAPFGVIASVTGLSEARLTELSQTITATAAPAETSDPNELAAELLADGMTSDEVREVTGLNAAEIKKLVS